jgi:hypothetical protein
MPFQSAIGTGKYRLAARRHGHVEAGADADEPGRRRHRARLPGGDLLLGAGERARRWMPGGEEAVERHHQRSRLGVRHGDDGPDELARALRQERHA